MIKKKEIKKKLDYYLSFRKDGGFPFDCFEECMWAIVLKKALENYNKQFFESSIKELIKNFEKNASNLRGLADAYEVKAFLWILKKELEDFKQEIEFTGVMPSKRVGRIPIPKNDLPSSFSQYSEIKNDSESD